MDKLFEKCIEKSKNTDMAIVWQVVECVKRNEYPELTVNEVFEMIFWDVMLTDYVIASPQIKMIFVKYGDEAVSFMKEYIKNSNKDYRLYEKDKLIFEDIIKKLT